MIKSIRYLVFSLFVISFCVLNVEAYTKEDIINLTNNVNTCSSETKALLDGTRASYTRILNERNVSDKDLNKVYSNVKMAMEILSNNGLCSVEQKEDVSESLKNRLYQLFQETSDIILSSPLVGQSNNSNNTNPVPDTDINNNNGNSNNQTTDSKVVIDSSTNQIKIYENGTLTNVIELEQKLNYVGLNKILIISIEMMVACLFSLLLIRRFSKSNIIVTSMFYVLLFILPLTFIFRNQISIVLDTISLMNVNINEKEKEVLVDGEKIISYPSYGSKYATIYINNNKGDVYFGDDSSILKKGVGQANSSYLPGENKKTILSGHNTGVFKELFNVEKNDDVIIETVYGKFTYNVDKIKIIDDNDVNVLSSDYDLIMYTCYPAVNLYGDKRIAVFANIIDKEWVGGIHEK